MEAAASAAPKVASRYLIQDDSAGPGVGAAARSSSLTSFGSTVATPLARAGAVGASPAAATGTPALEVCGRNRRSRHGGRRVFGPLDLSGRRRHRRRRNCGRIDRLLLLLRLGRLGAGRSARCFSFALRSCLLVLKRCTLILAWCRLICCLLARRCTGCGLGRRLGRLRRIRHDRAWKAIVVAGQCGAEWQTRDHPSRSRHDCQSA